CISFVVFNAHAAPWIYPLSLPDALPISNLRRPSHSSAGRVVQSSHQIAGCFHATSLMTFRIGPAMMYRGSFTPSDLRAGASYGRSEEHTSELQSRFDLVCRLLLEKKKKK